MTRPLPDFSFPPVTEVVLGVQFEKLEAIQTPQLGYIWHAFRDRFPLTEEHAPLAETIEQFGPKAGRRPGVRLEFSPAPQRPRVWHLNEATTELVQVQHDRFVRNWRKQDASETYPRYRNLRELFRQDFETFRNLVESERWGAVEPNQCEITYVNVIPAGEGWQEHGELDKVLTVFTTNYSDKGLGVPEEAAVNLRFILQDDDEPPVGRLYVAATPVFRVADNRAAIQLTLTARGKPEGSGLEGIMRFVDRGHGAIVRAFAAVTTPAMHRIWGRTQ